MPMSCTTGEKTAKKELQTMGCEDSQATIPLGRSGDFYGEGSL